MDCRIPLQDPPPFVAVIPFFVTIFMGEPARLTLRFLKCKLDLNFAQNGGSTKMKNRFWRAVSAVLLASFLAGCGGVSNETSDKNNQLNPASAAKVTLTMWVMPNSLEPIKDIEALLEPFKRQYPNIDIKVTPVDWGSAWTKITTAATSGDTPDVVQLGSTWVGAISTMGALVDLKDKATELGSPETFLPSAWASSGIEGSGKVTSIPWFVDGRAMYYRTDVFRKLGLTRKDIDTWDAFEKTMDKISHANLEIEGIHVSALGIPGKNDWNVIHNIAPWIWGAGGDFLSPDRTKSSLDAPEAAKGLSFYTSLVKKGYVPIECLELNTAQVSSNFNNGSYAMYFDGPYEVKTLTLPTEQGGAAGSVASRNFAVAPYPAGPKGRYTFTGGSNLAVFKATKHPAEAWLLIKHLLSRESQVQYAKATGFLPSTKAAFEDPFFTNDPYRKVFKEAVQYGRIYPCVGGWGLIEPVLTRRFGIMWDHVIAAPSLGELPSLISEELKLAAKEVNTVLASGQVATTKP